MSGLLRFQNTDLNEGRNLLGRLTLAVTTSVNDQHKLGLDLDGNIGGNLFSPTVFGPSNVMTPQPPAVVNTGGATMTLSVADDTKFSASDYEIQFNGATTGSITRRSDGTVTLFDTSTSPINAITIDGLNITQAGGAAPGDRFLVKPYTTSASNVSAQFANPRALAVASPVAATMGTTNTGSLQQISVAARSNPVAPAALGVVLTFTSSNTYTRSDQGATVFNYTPGQAIEATVTGPPLADWSLTLQGTPQVGDTVTVNTNPFPTLSAGNATAILALRDTAMFDGAAMTDGYAGLISQIGVRAQSADYAAQVSSTIATNVESDRAAVSGVNLDEEAAKLLQFQQAYQASAKMIATAQTVFSALLASMGP